MDLQADTSFSLTEQQISTHLDNDTLILNIDTGKYFSLEGVGTFIWQAITAGDSVQTIEQKIMTTFEVSAEQS